MQDVQIFLQPQLLTHTGSSRCSTAYLRPQRVPHGEHSSLILYGSRLKGHLLLNNIGFYLLLQILSSEWSNVNYYH